MPLRKVNLSRVRGLLADDGSVMTFAELGGLTGVLPKSAQGVIVEAMAECCGLKIARTPSGKVLGVRRWTANERTAPFSEPSQEDLLWLLKMSAEDAQAAIDGRG